MLRSQDQMDVRSSGPACRASALRCDVQPGSGAPGIRARASRPVKPLEAFQQFALLRSRTIRSSSSSDDRKFWFVVHFVQSRDCRGKAKKKRFPTRDLKASGPAAERNNEVLDPYGRRRWFDPTVRLRPLTATPLVQLFATSSCIASHSPLFDDGVVNHLGQLHPDGDDRQRDCGLHCKLITVRHSRSPSSAVFLLDVGEVGTARLRRRAVSHPSAEFTYQLFVDRLSF